MKFDTLKKSHKKSIIIGVSLLIILGAVLITRFTFAKYELVKSIKIADGTINYKVPDFKIMAMYKQKDDATCTEDSCYSETTTIPNANNYIINESKSYCTIDNNKETGIVLKTVHGRHTFDNLNKNSKCYIYYDNIKISNAKEIIASKELLVREDFTKIITEDTTGKIYMAADDDGISYYYVGAPNDNYVKFAGLWWRIIRINGDGSIRLIYDGTSVHANGTSTADSIAVSSQTFNASYDNNAYVGFRYTANEVHGLGTKSNVLEQLETWYTSNLSSYADKIDTNAGFCGDREPSTTMGSSNGSGGTGTITTYYGAHIRIVNSPGSWNTTQTPTFKCKNSSDLYTMSSSNKGNKSLSYPIGLISANEVVYAGGFGETNNTSYYLYNGQNYWTLSPSTFDGSYARVFVVGSAGYLSYSNVNIAVGIRPVINLKADITLIGNGTTSDPYVVS